MVWQKYIANLGKTENIYYELIELWIVVGSWVVVRTKVCESIYWFYMVKAFIRNRLTSPPPPPPVHFKSGIKIKINLNFYFRTSLWCHKGLHKTFYGTTKSVKTKIEVNFFSLFGIGTGKVKRYVEARMLFLRFCSTIMKPEKLRGSL